MWSESQSSLRQKIQFTGFVLFYDQNLTPGRGACICLVHLAMSASNVFVSALLLARGAVNELAGEISSKPVGKFVFSYLVLIVEMSDVFVA